MSRSSSQLEARVLHQEELFAAVRAAHPGPPPPYFAHLRLRTAAGESDLLLGSTHLLGKGPSIIDWRTAPLAEAFFAHSEGEDYEIDVGGRIVTGAVLEKNLLVFDGGALVRVEWEGGGAKRTPEGWRPLQQPLHPRIPPRPPSARRPFRSPLEVQLDPEQRRVVDLPDDRSVLLLGEAGFGKTTVALHRLVALKERSARRFKAAVVVPTPGLKRLTELMLQRRGTEGVEVFTYDAFASRMARKLFRDLPKRESEGASGNVVRLKRHGALRGVLAEYVRRHPKPPADPERGAKSRARARRSDLEHLFGDTAWMEKVVARSGGALGPGVVADVAEHTRVQFLEPAEREYSHVDREARVTVDGQRMDQGTPTEDAESVDAEDYAVLFELERLRAVSRREKPAPLPTYDCVLVDEAQELAPLELALIARTVGPKGTVIVAGDAAQQVDPTSDFGGWDQVMADLGAPGHERATLVVNYRCPPDVTALARVVIGYQAEAPASLPNVVLSEHAGALHLSAWLIDQLRELRGVDPTASVALVTRSATAARALARVLAHGLAVRLSLGGDFEFRPGVLVTSVEEVKGLEFDYVVVPDADPLTYADIGQDRRALYVAVTRATHRLVLATPSRWSTLVQAEKGDRLLFGKK